MGFFRSIDVRKLLHNKFVVVLGDSIQRSVYKDLLKLLQNDEYLSDTQIRCKGRETFEKEKLVEGGVLTGMHNMPTYREVLQYRTGHHLVRFYFLTRVYSTYLESILSDFQSGPQPDVLIVNSCVWDLTRYDDKHLEAYKTNLDVLFQRLREVLSPECLIVWTMTMPVGYKDNTNQEYTANNIRMDIIEGNFFSATLGNFHKLNVLDMHYYFRHNLRLRCHDAVHWNPWAHRKYTQILLTHIAQAWGVQVPKGEMSEGSTVHPAPPHLVALRQDPYPRQHPTIQGRERCGLGKIPAMRCAGYMPGYTSFDGIGIGAMTADSPFVMDNPLLTANIHPGYFTPRPGPMLNYNPFTGRNFVFPIPPNMNFTPIANHAPYLQKATNMKIRRRKGRTNPKP